MDEMNKNGNSGKTPQQPQGSDSQEDIKIWRRPQSGRKVRYVYEVQPENTKEDAEGMTGGDETAASQEEFVSNGQISGVREVDSQNAGNQTWEEQMRELQKGRDAVSQEDARKKAQEETQRETQQEASDDAGSSDERRKKRENAPSEAGEKKKEKVKRRNRQEKKVENPLEKDNVSKSVRQEFWKQQMVEGTAGENGIFRRIAGEIKAHYKRILSVVLILTLVFGGAYFYNKNRRYHAYDVEWQVSAVDNGYSHYLSFNDVILHYSQDGVSCINQNGEVMWNQAFNMDVPGIAVTGDYAVIYDIKGTSLYICNKEGCTGSAETTKKILKADISAAGVVAVVLDDKTSNYINYFRKDGSTIEVEIKTLISGDGYPLDIAISPDGNQLISSYIYAKSGIMMNRVVFRNFEVGKNEVDRTVGGFEQYEETLVPEVIFFDNQNSAAITEQSIDFYSTQNALEPELARTQEFNYRIKTVFYNQEYVGVVLDSAVKHDSADNAEEAQTVEAAAADEGTVEAETKQSVNTSYTMLVFDKTGSRVFEQDIDFEYEYADFSGDGIVVYNNNTLATYNLTGVRKYQTKMDVNIEGVVRFAENNLVVYGNGALQKLTLK